MDTAKVVSEIDDQIAYQEKSGMLPVGIVMSTVTFNALIETYTFGIIPPDREGYCRFKGLHVHMADSMADGAATVTGINPRLDGPSLMKQLESRPSTTSGWEVDGTLIRHGDGILTMVIRIYGDSTDQELKRMASLMSAAPELWAALRDFVAGHHDCSAMICETYEEALAAIAKAEGRDA